MHLKSLTDETILTYFSASPFYSLDSINERVKMGVIGASQATQYVGIEYVLRPRAPGLDSLGLFVIERRMRRSPTDVTTISAYYCLHGTIYQCADLGSLLSARIEKAAYHITEATKALERARHEATAAAAASSSSSSKSGR